MLTDRRFAARGDDVLIVMMDGWMARFRGERWAEVEESRTGHVDWHESKSAVIFRLSQAVDVSDTRRTIIDKHVVIAPPERLRPVNTEPGGGTKARRFG